MLATLAAAAGLVVSDSISAQLGGPLPEPVQIPLLILVDAERLGRLDGAWRGKLQVVTATARTPAEFWRGGENRDFQLFIDREAAIVKVKDDEWREVLVGHGFRTRRSGASALISAVEVGPDRVQQWSLSVAKQDIDTLLVFVSVLGGGALDRVEQVDDEFAVVALGELERFEGWPSDPQD